MGVRMMKSPEVALFVTCLADLMRPSVGFAAVKLLEDAGCAVSVPMAQTCCGQPAYTGGDRAAAGAIAARVIAAFEGYEYIVAPSGSCAAMIRQHYPALFDGDADMSSRARAVGGRTYELITFLTEVLGVDTVNAEYQGVATYHDSCSGLREMGIKPQPRKLLRRVRGLELKESLEAETCCGFGGSFCVEYPGISQRMTDGKIDDIEASGADTLLAGDLGCLLTIAARLQGRGSPIKVRHVAEVLAGIADDVAPVGEG